MAGGTLSGREQTHERPVKGEIKYWGHKGGMLFNKKGLLNSTLILSYQDIHLTDIG